MGKIRTVLWDWNGTLLDDLDYTLGHLNDLLREHGLTARERERHREEFDFPVMDYYRRVGFDLETTCFETVSLDFVKRYVSGIGGCRLFPGVPELLQWMTEKGFRMGVLSAAHQEHLDQFIERFGLGGFFEWQVGIDNFHATGKSGRGIEWLGEVGIPAEEVILIGDTVHDFEVAKAMGIQAWLVATGHHSERRLRATGARVSRDLEEIREELKRLL